MIKKLSNNVFKRYEKKYLLTSQQKNSLENIITQYMELDDFCKQNEKYLIRNVYYDTTNNDLIRKSIEKPFFKEKIRVRKYGNFGEFRDEYFLEIKRKCNGEVYKRRVKLNEFELENLFNNHHLPDTNRYLDQQVLKEINYFLGQYSIIPKAFITYERIAYYDKNDTSFRLTFDNNIYSRLNNFDFDSQNYDYRLLNDGYYLMEIKMSGVIPIWLSKVLSDLKIFPTNFSKYGKHYELLIEKEKNKYVNV